MAETKKESAFALFDEEKRPSSLEVKALGLKAKTCYNYFQEWKKMRGATPEDNGGSEGSPEGSSPQSKKVDGGAGGTNILHNAQTLRFVPRFYTTDYSPIIRSAQDAAVEFWGWPKDMPLGDFLDTALHFLFMEHGITLAGYTISDEAREKLEVESKAQETQETKEPQEVVG